jgi:hypothetical protein
LTADIHSSGSQPREHRAFTAFSSRHFRIFFFAATAAMMADNIEHVITYLVLCIGRFRAVGQLWGGDCPVVRCRIR